MTILNHFSKNHKMVEKGEWKICVREARIREKVKYPPGWSWHERYVKEFKRLQPDFLAVYSWEEGRYYVVPLLRFLKRGDPCRFQGQLFLPETHFSVVHIFDPLLFDTHELRILSLQALQEVCQS